MDNNKFTPAGIGTLRFSIPLYQRLFTWEQPQIENLLNDLFNSFEKNKEQPYYIGMFTVYHTGEDCYDLVDGQQRCTMLMLLGISFGWRDFVLCDNQSRLQFFARKHDQQYLNNKIVVAESGYMNQMMENALSYIDDFLKNKVGDQADAFKDYVYHQTTFFLSELPRQYDLKALTRHFERMNQTGKNLENHEILKVRLLKLVSPDKYDYYTRLWNVVSEMDKSILPELDEDAAQSGNTAVLNLIINAEARKEFIGKEALELNESFKLSEIQADKNKPTTNSAETQSRAIIDFSEFLLIVLSTQITVERASEHFNKLKLLSTFEVLTQTAEVEAFLDTLFECRLLLDYHIIRSKITSNSVTGYSVQVSGDEVAKKRFSQYQSMLYVSTQAHVWLKPFLIYLRGNKDSSVHRSLQYLQEWDDERLHGQNIDLNYGAVNRYWFWRLDYYLWEERSSHFDDVEHRKIAESYIFRPNRSIEHIAPQNPKTNSNVTLQVELLHCFGNLVMISGSENSRLQNSSYDMKKAYVESFINGSVSGSVESLKMLKVHHDYKTWNEDQVKTHHDEMIEILISSFSGSRFEEAMRKKIGKQRMTQPAEAVS
ncbi:MAG: DUF262 domain-containing protein [Chryseobacterium sp.]|nr:MAG: DUF262 domain-containing protein [Chryseobacterium sp.]